MNNSNPDGNPLIPQNETENTPLNNNIDEMAESTDRYLNGANKFIISERLRKKIIFIAKMGGLKENNNFFDPDLDWKTIHNYDDPFTQLFLDHTVDSITPEVVRTNYEYLLIFWKNIKDKAESAENRNEFSNTYGLNFWDEALNLLDTVYEKLNTVEKIKNEQEKLANQESSKLNFVLINKIEKRLTENLLTPDDVKNIFIEGEKIKITEDQTVEILWDHLVKLGWKPINGEKNNSNKKECLLNLDWGPLCVMDLKRFITSEMQDSTSSDDHFNNIIVEAKSLGIGEDQAIFILWDYLMKEGWEPESGEMNELKKKDSLFNSLWVPGHIKSISNLIESSMSDKRLTKDKVEKIISEASQNSISEDDAINFLWNALEKEDWEPVTGEKDSKNKKGNLFSSDWTPASFAVSAPAERTYTRSSAAQRTSPALVAGIVAVLAAIIFSIFGLPSLLENKDAIAEERGDENQTIKTEQLVSENNQNISFSGAAVSGDNNLAAGDLNKNKMNDDTADDLANIESDNLPEENIEAEELSSEAEKKNLEKEAAAKLAAIELIYVEISAEFENLFKRGKVDNAKNTLSRLNSFINENNLDHSTSKYRSAINRVEKMAFIPGKNIYMDKYEVTVREYKDYTKSKAGVKFPFLPDWNQDATQPIINVSFDDAEGFAKANGKRIPTLDEWKAAAGLSKSNDNFFNDDESPRQYANVYDLVSSTNDTYTRTAPVGKFSPNKNNLFDLVGNVEEWCITSNNVPTCVGGDYKTKESRSKSFRSKTHRADYTSERVGFRCVVDVDSLLN